MDPGLAEAARQRVIDLKASIKPTKKRAGLPDITLEELAARANDTNLLLGCRGIVFDVSSNAEAYGPGLAYNVFIGKDATVALAKMKFDAEFLDPNIIHWKDLKK